MDGEKSVKSGSSNIEEVVNRLRFLANSFDYSERCGFGRALLDAVRSAIPRPPDVEAILELLTYLVDNGAPDQRLRCLDVLPDVALLLSDPNHNCENLRSLISSHILPIVVTGLSEDADLYVVKGADSSLVTLLEHCLVPNEFVKESVWPAVTSRMHKFPSIESTVRVISMMSKMVPWVGCDTTETLFVPLFNEMCSSPEFLVRKMCASIIGDFCAVVNLDTVESLLVPSFIDLCGDNMWGVRKTCAEVIMSVSSACSAESRRIKLVPVFAALLSDQIKEVQFSAFHSLGPFITTFAEPSITNIGYNHQGELVLKHPDGFEFKLHSSNASENIGVHLGPLDSMEQLNIGRRNNMDNLLLYLAENPDFAEQAQKEQEALIKVDTSKEDDNFNQFSFWREPIPNIDLDPNITDNKGNEEKKNISSDNEMTKDNSSPNLRVYIDSLLSEKITQRKNSKSHPNHDKLIDLASDRLYLNQEVVPQELINHFVSMSTPSEDKGLNELAQHCAYNLPAVALTLGPHNWPLIKETYQALAADKQWKVRRIVASSIHELALIVGEDVATEDLIPIFSGFIMDLDEVRIGALRHLANFLKSVRPSGRNMFLPKLTEFLMTDYEWNWRFRAELGNQLLQVINLFSAQDISQHLTTLVFSLLQDKVAYVRKIALHLVCEVLMVLNREVSLVSKMVCELAEQFAHSNRWSRRQTFAHLCACILVKRALPNDLFARDILPHLLDLSWDWVPNVRLAVARTLSQHVMPMEYYSNPCSPHHEVVMVILKRLEADKDRDVSYLAQSHISPQSQTDLFTSIPKLEVVDNLTPGRCDSSSR